MPLGSGSGSSRVSPLGEPLLAALVATASVGAVLALGALGGDPPAHLYRTHLVREGVVLWDTFWYAGHYPLASYSVAYYLAAAAVGNVALVALAAVPAAALFASVAVSEWGDAARWPARVFAVLSAAPLVTGTYAYALGLTTLLGSLRAFQTGRRNVGVALAVLTLATSPLAFLFLCLVLIAVGVAARMRPGEAWHIAAAVAATAALAATASFVLFPTHARYPFASPALAAAVLVGAALAAVAAGSERGRVLAVFFGVWTLACVAAYLVESPVGANVTRLRFAVLPLALLAVLLARCRPRPLAAAVLALAAAYTLLPLAQLVPKTMRKVSHEERAWAPVLTFLDRHATPDHRVDVVPTAAHWEAYFLPRRGFALARGWYRQLDLADNERLYRRELTPREYRAWLQRRGVRFVVLPRRFPLEEGGRAKAELLRSGRSRLVPVLRTPRFVVYEVPEARPLLTGPAPAHVTALEHDRIEGWTAAPGMYRLRVKYTPYWRVRVGVVCVEDGGSGIVDVAVLRPGKFELAVPRSPREIVGAVGAVALDAVADEPRDGACPSVGRSGPHLE